MTKAVTYLRVSGDAQIDGDGFPRQRATIQKYADKNEVEIVREFRDEGITGKMELENREALSACIAFVQEHGIGLVLVEDQTRLARDLIVAEVCIREFQKANVRVIAASGGVDLTEGDDSNPTAKLIRQILSAVSEFERCVIVLKLNGARQRIREKNGKCEGRKAFGERPEEHDALLHMQSLRAMGVTTTSIACNLNRHGFKTRSGKPWRGTVVAKILARERAMSKTT